MPVTEQGLASSACKAGHLCQSLPSRFACHAGLQGRTTLRLLRGVLAGVGERCHLVPAHDSQAQGILVDALGDPVLLVPDACVLPQQRPLREVLSIT